MAQVKSEGGGLVSDELKDNCGNCTAFHSDRQGSRPGTVAPGECRATPPVPSNRFAKVKSDEWCRDSFKATAKHSMAKVRAKKGKKDGSEADSED